MQEQSVPFLFGTAVASAGALIQQKMLSMTSQRLPYFKNLSQYLAAFLVVIFSLLGTITSCPKKNLMCEPRIENAYYNHKERKLKLKDICIYCGKSGSSGSFILTLPELCEQNLTDVYDCFPIWIPCLNINKKVVNGSQTEDQVQARQESIAKTDAKKSEKIVKATAKKGKNWSGLICQGTWGI